MVQRLPQSSRAVHVMLCFFAVLNGFELVQESISFPKRSMSLQIHNKNMGPVIASQSSLGSAEARNAPSADRKPSASCAQSTGGPGPWRRPWRSGRFLGRLGKWRFSESKKGDPQVTMINHGWLVVTGTWLDYDFPIILGME